MSDMSLIKYLARLGYGGRREVTALVRARRVTRADGSILRDGDAWTHADVRVDLTRLDPAPGCVLMLHKPIGYVCSTSDVPPLVYELLPERFRARTPIIAPVGRLDRETSGLLLLTDDGRVNHRITSPRTHLPRTYLVTLSDDLRGDEGDVFASGTLQLRSDTSPLAPATLVVLSPREVRLTLTEGRYHQVRRMFAAVGNHVQALHRAAIGALEPADLAAGSWRALTQSERESLGA